MIVVNTQNIVLQINIEYYFIFVDTSNLVDIQINIFLLGKDQNSYKR